MQFRSATQKDTSAIVYLLKRSLGESTIPKSELLWDWKHNQNPFGPSYILLAEENEQLVGLRAFMQWEWQWKGQIYKAIRAVDTATHPDHQGKGIFKKLTLHQIDICKQEGIGFVFNTPNDQSKPGYLKMGWVDQGRLPLKFKLLRPLSLVFSRIFKEKKNLKNEEDLSLVQTWRPDISNLIKEDISKSDHLSSYLSPRYISWRYEKNPLFTYNYFTDHTNFLMISRIKKHSFARELRLVEFVLLNRESDLKKLNTEIKKQVLEFCKKNKIDIISVSGLQYALYKACFRWMGIIPIKDMGPSITLRDLNMNEQFPHLLKIDNWNYSLGDLELF